MIVAQTDLGNANNVPQGSVGWAAGLAGKWVHIAGQYETNS